MVKVGRHCRLRTRALEVCHVSRGVCVEFVETVLREGHYIDEKSTPQILVSIV
jgi:hypothetical protein